MKNKRRFKVLASASAVVVAVALVAGATWMPSGNSELEAASGETESTKEPAGDEAEEAGASGADAEDSASADSDGQDSSGGSQSGDGASGGSGAQSSGGGSGDAGTTAYNSELQLDTTEDEAVADGGGNSGNSGDSGGSGESSNVDNGSQEGGASSSTTYKNELPLDVG